MAQEHLTFKGIPIKGNIANFCLKLRCENFSFIGIENNTALLSGNFIGRETTVYAYATDDTKNVYSVVALFNPTGEWDTLTSNYYYCKDLYTRKYGEPTTSREYNPASYDSNASLMLEVAQSRVEYFSVWEVQGGNIQLSIEKAGNRFGFEGLVMIRYQDSQNVEAKIQNDLDDI